MTPRSQHPEGTVPENLLERLKLRLLPAGNADGKFSIRESVAVLLGKPVPHISWWSCFGGIAFFLFLVQVATGILLMFFYIPSAPEAHITILFLGGEVPFGWFFRTIHYWSGMGMMIAVSVHVMRVFIKGAYQRPRHLNWVIGCALFFLTVGFTLTGDLLPWTESAYWSAVWWTDLVERFPVIGHQLMLFLRGGEKITGLTITRFYVFHVFLLPALSVLLMIIHFAIVRKQGISEPL